MEALERWPNRTEEALERWPNQTEEALERWPNQTVEALERWPNRTEEALGGLIKLQGWPYCAGNYSVTTLLHRPGSKGKILCLPIILFCSKI